MTFALRTVLAVAAVFGLPDGAARAATTTVTMYTYCYNGPAFPGGGNVSVRFTVPSVLGKSAVYSGLPTGTYAGTISLNSPNASNAFSLSIQVFDVATDAKGGILSWAIGAASSNLGKVVPTTGSSHALWTINSLAQTLPAPKAAATPMADDWATTKNYYLKCTGVAGCEVDDGQPTVVAYSAQVLTGGGAWSMWPVKVTVSCTSSGGSGRSGNCPPYRIVEQGN